MIKNYESLHEKPRCWPHCLKIQNFVFDLSIDCPPLPKRSMTVFFDVPKKSYRSSIRNPALKTIKLSFEIPLNFRIDKTVKRRYYSALKPLENRIHVDENDKAYRRRLTIDTGFIRWIDKQNYVSYPQ